MIWLLLIGWVAATVGGVLLGERRSDLTTLQDGLRSGSVDVVQVAGALEGIGRTVSGCSVVQLRWTTGVVERVTEVVQVRRTRGGGGFVSSGCGGDDATGQVRGDLATYLSGFDPDVRVEQVPFGGVGMEMSAFGWTLSGSSALALLALTGATLCVVVVAPEPNGATRWAWGWLVFLLPPVGAIAYLLLSGPAITRRGPRPLAGRLTGGWAFLLCVVVAGVLSSGW